MKKLPEQAQSTAGIRRTFSKIRILSCLENGPLDLLALRDRFRGCQIEPAALRRSLCALARDGLLKPGARTARRPRPQPTYSLSPGGRRTLRFARQQLILIARTWPPTIASNGNTKQI